MTITSTTEVTSTFEARFGGFRPETVEQWADEVMVALDAHPGAIGPMVVADIQAGAFSVSFELLNATGNVATDAARAVAILNEALAREHEIDVLGTVDDDLASRSETSQLVYAL